MFFKMTSNSDDAKVVTAPPPDAAVVKKNVPPPPPDAPEVNKNDIIALSKFGFFTIDATAKTTIYVDNVRYGETPMQRLPLNPGPHKVKAVTKGKKAREFMSKRRSTGTRPRLRRCRSDQARQIRARRNVVTLATQSGT
jgi:hypothetical protein